MELRAAAVLLARLVLLSLALLALLTLPVLRALLLPPSHAYRHSPHPASPHRPPPAPPLAPAQLAAWTRDGFLVVRRAIPAPLLAKLNIAAADLEANQGPATDIADRHLAVRSLEH